MDINKSIEYIKKYIKKVNRKTIELDSLLELDEEYSVVFSLVEELVKLGYLKAMGSDTNHKPHPLYKAYRITMNDGNSITDVEKKELINELNYVIHQNLEIDKYKSDLNLYKSHRKYVKLLSSYLKNNSNHLNVECSINERSYEIFREEKFLKDDPFAKSILETVGLTFDKLNLYYTPEPFFYYTVNKENLENIIIVENKDTFYTLKKLLNEGKTNYWNINFGTVIYGEGKKVTSSFEDIFYNNSLEYMRSNNITFYYWGDIDKEGVYIYQELKSKYPSIKLKLFEAAYEKMVETSKIYGLQEGKHHRVKPKTLEELNINLRTSIEEILKTDIYIPQEIISNRILREV